MIKLLNWDRLYLQPHCTWEVDFYVKTVQVADRPWLYHLYPDWSEWSCRLGHSTAYRTTDRAKRPILSSWWWDRPTATGVFRCVWRHTVATLIPNDLWWRSFFSQILWNIPGVRRNPQFAGIKIIVDKTRGWVEIRRHIYLGIGWNGFQVSLRQLESRQIPPTLNELLPQSRIVENFALWGIRRYQQPVGFGAVFHPNVKSKNGLHTTPLCSCGTADYAGKQALVNRVSFLAGYKNNQIINLAEELCKLWVF